MNNNQQLSFENTEIAFRNATDFDLKRAYWLFRVINVNFLLISGISLVISIIAAIANDQVLKTSIQLINQSVHRPILVVYFNQVTPAAQGICSLNGSIYF